MPCYRNWRSERLLSCADTADGEISRLPLLWHGITESNHEPFVSIHHRRISFTLEPRYEIPSGRTTEAGHRNHFGLVAMKFEAS